MIHPNLPSHLLVTPKCPAPIQQASLAAGPSQLPISKWRWAVPSLGTTGAGGRDVCTSGQNLALPISSRVTLAQTAGWQG